MYETFFGLERRPFLAVPDTDLFFSTPSMNESRQTVERIVRRGEGIALVIGESGTGKTLLLRMIRKSLDVEYTVSLLLNGRLETPKAFLQQVLFDLRLPFANADETELRLALWDFARQESTPGFVLLIDDAQQLNGLVFEEIRLLTNCDDGAVPFFRVVLAGTAELDEKLTNPTLGAFSRRVVSRSYLDTLNREETAHYVSWQTSSSRQRAKEIGEFVDPSGRSGDIRRLDAPHGSRTESIFTDGAKRLIYQLTDGMPRLINQLCDAALILAAERVARSVDETLLQAAWAQLQQIPEALQTSRPVAVVPEEDDQPTENLDELIARKKVTLVLKEFDSSVEFGTLEDPELSQPQRESSYSEEEWENDEVEKLIQIEVPIYVHAASIDLALQEDEAAPETNIVGAIDREDLLEVSPPDLDEAIDEMVVSVNTPSEELAVVEASPFSGDVCRRIPYPHRKRRVDPDVPRKYLKHRLYRQGLRPGSLSLTCRSFDSMFDPWIGCLTIRILFLPVRWATPSIISEQPKEVPTPMDQETLELYGREVLEGRPPFVRKEPQYAYQAVEETTLESYPHPFYELPLSWLIPQCRGEYGYGIPYSEFLQKEQIEPEYEAASLRPGLESAGTRIPDSPILRQVLHPCRPMTVSPTTGLDEIFDEWETVEKRFVFTEEHCQRGESTRSASLHQTLPEDDALSQKIEAIVLRITRAAEKIERAADVSENAGQLVRRAAEYVETEVQTALPTYKELFQQLSDFQRTITAEVADLRIGSEVAVPVAPLPTLPKQDKCVLAFPVSDTGSLKPSRLGSPQALFEFSNVETERRIDAKTLFQ